MWLTHPAVTVPYLKCAMNRYRLNKGKKGKTQTERYAQWVLRNKVWWNQLSQDFTLVAIEAPSVHCLTDQWGRHIQSFKHLSPRIISLSWQPKTIYSLWTTTIKLYSSLPVTPPCQMDSNELVGEFPEGESMECWLFWLTSDRPVFNWSGKNNFCHLTQVLSLSDKTKGGQSIFKPSTRQILTWTSERTSFTFSFYNWFGFE